MIFTMLYAWGKSDMGKYINTVSHTHIQTYTHSYYRETYESHGAKRTNHWALKPRGGEM